MTRPPEAPTTPPRSSAKPLVTVTAGVGVTWALIVLGEGAVRVYNAWEVHQWFVRNLKAPGADVTHPGVLGGGVLPLLSAIDFLVFLPLTLLWLVLTAAVSLSGRPGRSGRLYLAVVVVAVAPQILFSVAAGPAASQPSGPFHPALFTSSAAFSMLLTLDGLIALVGSVWLWRRGSR